MKGTSSLSSPVFRELSFGARKQTATGEYIPELPSEPPCAQ